jgi:hypothetical protein
MGTEYSKSGDILTVVTTAILEVAEALSPVANNNAVPKSLDPQAAKHCQSGVCPVSWKPRRPAAA